MAEKDFEPVIIAFLCNWCTATAADLAGTMRIQYPANIRPIRVMCSGAVDQVYILRAFLSGADGVIIGGCKHGDCHYISGNYKARRRIHILRTIMDTLGLEHERIQVNWISAAEGRIFADIMTDFTNTIREMGPSLVKANAALF
ncbi:MAG: hydrogenase iron-sulfur subunit [Leptospirales bacterium]|nr:hydrogenase iron-sulfur subunit [Leptospirales bacterium]